MFLLLWFDGCVFILMSKSKDNMFAVLLTTVILGAGSFFLYQCFFGEEGNNYNSLDEINDKDFEDDEEETNDDEHKNTDKS